MIKTHRCTTTDVRRVLWLNLLLLLFTAGGAVLALVLAEIGYGLAVMIVGMAISQVVLSRGLRRSGVAGLDQMVDSIEQMLDSQNDTLAAQQHEIAQLRATLEGSPSQDAQTMLATRTGPDLIAVVEQLCEAEQSLPDLLPQTREWIAQIRGEAVQAQDRVARLHGDRPVIHRVR